ncbi:acyl-CoA dehydrogenase family protein [Truepera radiovictrix]|uniref:Acyl-CoA dehydrogenase domain protein n=1 Tax=Truepera radiovictrix (strain DSM 17093 / CIP 108686 / LMG 22925 / RQ-24) TaxID=649638 RepID=D7CSL2_TRURR|nr:acyl-CoA dehydrogenase family protein [Truepera radiovictrix]ADI15432.1 acyl-CoA dehydrogenase domain protein [Truepera radiovictrix DSM 17093]WMT56018.1 acyl-CoA dehydrogenase family protein [Truepera radiovictrix]
MIDFSLTDEQRQFRALAREFARDVIAPVAAEHDREESYPEAVVARGFELGLLNTGIPASLGGLGLGMVDEVLIGEELAYACMGIYCIFMASELGITPILVAGSEEQQARLLKPLLEGPKLAAFALSEPDNGSDAGAMKTRARLEGDEVVLNGTKMWISNGGLAELTVVFATFDPEAKHRGTLAVVVEGTPPGMSYQKIHGKLGQRACVTAELVFEDVRVPAANILGEPGDGFRIAMKTLDKTRIPVAAGSVGLARRALDESRRYSAERHAFGRPINSFQALQFKMADMKIGIETARLQTLYAAWLVDSGQPHTEASAIAKAYASDMAFAAANEAIQIHGGYGYVGEYPVEKLLRDVKLNQIYEGTNEIQRVVIARGLLQD